MCVLKAKDILLCERRRHISKCVRYFRCLELIILAHPITLQYASLDFCVNWKFDRVSFAFETEMNFNYIIVYRVSNAKIYANESWHPMD